MPLKRFEQFHLKKIFLESFFVLFIHHLDIFLKQLKVKMNMAVFNQDLGKYFLFVS